MFTTGQAPLRHRVALLFGAVGVASLFAVALPRLTAAGNVAPTAAASAATVKIDNFTFLAALDAELHGLKIAPVGVEVSRG
jgi:hypothetical protein